MNSSTNHRKTKILITLGRASLSVDSLVSLLKEGIDGVRITTRFLRPEERKLALDNLREAEEIVGRQVCVILSLREGDIRIGSAKAGCKISLNPGDIMKIVAHKYNDLEPNTIICNNSAFISSVHPGDKLLVEHGKSILTVLDIINLDSLSPHTKPEDESSFNIKKSTSENSIERYKRSKPKQQKVPKTVICRVENECVIDSENPLNFMNASSIDPNKVTNELEDIHLIEWSWTLDIDIIIYKQIRDKEDLNDLWSFAIPPNSKRYVGIQTKETAENPDEYLDCSEGCFIGRGVLGIETSHSKVCSLQKQLISKCNLKGIPVIVSTQVLESMVVNNKPSRAEVVDSYCAVTDGADCLMLTGETAYGRYPDLSVKTLNRICIEAEQHIDYKKHREVVYSSLKTPLPVMVGICYFAADAVEKIGANLIICLTKSGGTAKTLAKFTPCCMIAAITDSVHTLKLLRVVRGVEPILADTDTNLEIEAMAVKLCIENRLVLPGQKAIMVGSSKDYIQEGTTMSFRVIDIS